MKKSDIVWKDIEAIDFIGGYALNTWNTTWFMFLNKHLLAFEFEQ